MIKISRLQAFLLRLLVTFVIFLILRYLVVPGWYPHALLQSDGGWQGIRLIIMVDLILGPLLTLILFKPGKPGLKLDMLIITVLQIFALTWGTLIVYQERPYALVFSEGYFKPLTSKQFKSSGVSRNFVTQLSKHRPYLVYSALPEDNDELAALRKEALIKKRPLYFFAEYYRPFSPASLTTLKKASFKPDDLLNNKPNIDKQVANKIRQYQDNDKYVYLAMRSRYNKDIVVFDTQTYSITDTLRLNPDAYRY